MDENKVQETTVAGQAPEPDQRGAADAQGQEPERFDAQYVKQLRAEAADYRKRLREAEAKVQEHETASLTETERLQKRLADLEREQSAYQRERQERTVRYEVMLAASRLNIIDPDAAYRLLDLAALTFDDEGMPTNIDEALKGLLKARPYLQAQIQTGQVGATNPGKDSTGHTETDAQRRARLFGGGGDPFRGEGGGVIWPGKLGE